MEHRVERFAREFSGISKDENAVKRGDLVEIRIDVK